MPVVSTIKMTSRQFLALGDDPPGVRLELVDGEVAVSPSPRPRHAHAFIALAALLQSHVRALDLGHVLADVDTVFGPNDVRRPDIIYFRKDRVHLIDLDSALNDPPDLCVEIVSPSSAAIDRVDKFEQYAAAGVGYYWIADPAKKTIEGFELMSGRYRLSGSGRDLDVVALSPFNDLKISLSEIWAPEISK